MKNIIYIALLLCFCISAIDAQSLMDRVAKTKEQTNKPTQTQTTTAGTTFGAATAGTSSSYNYQNFVNIKNRWKGNFINVENGPVETSSLGKNSWHSAQWTFEQGKDGYKMIKNRWKNSYLKATNGKLENSNAVGLGSHSAHWKIIPVSGTRYYKIQNRLTKTFLHTENGNIELGAIQDGWHSAQWENSSVKSDVPVNYDETRAKPLKYDYDVKIVHVKCIKVSSGEAGSANEYYGYVKFACDGKNKTALDIDEYDAWELTKNSSRPYTMREPFIITLPEGKSATLKVSGHMWEDDDTSSDDNLGTASAILDLKTVDNSGKDLYLNFEEDGDKVEVKIKVSRSLKVENQ